MKVDTLSCSRPKPNLTLKALRNNGTFTEGPTGSGGDGHTNLAEQIVLIIACEHLALSLHSSCYSFKATSNPSKLVANNSKLRNQSSRAVGSPPPQHLPPLSLKGAGFLCTANLIRLKRRWNKMLWRFSSTPCLGSDLAWPRSSCLPFLLAPYTPEVLSEGNELQEQAKFSLSRPGCAAGVFPEFFFHLLVLPNAALLSHHLGCFLLPPAELGSWTCVIVGCSSSPMSSVRTGIVSPSGAPVPGIGQATGLH